MRRRCYGNTGHQGAEEQQSTRLAPLPVGSGERLEALEQLGVVGQQASEPAQVAGKRGHPDVEQDVALPEAPGDLSTASAKSRVGVLDPDSPGELAAEVRVVAPDEVIANQTLPRRDDEDRTPGVLACLGRNTVGPQRTSRTELPELEEPPLRPITRGIAGSFDGLSSRAGELGLLQVDVEDVLGEAPSMGRLTASSTCPAPRTGTLSTATASRSSSSSKVRTSCTNLLS